MPNPWKSLRLALLLGQSHVSDAWPFLAKKPDPDNQARLVAFGGTIRALRVKSGLLEEQVSAACGMHPAYLRAIESGDRNPTYLTILHISKSFGMTPVELLEAVPEVVVGASADPIAVLRSVAEVLERAHQRAQVQGVVVRIDSLPGNEGGYVDLAFAPLHDAAPADALRGLDLPPTSVGAGIVYAPHVASVAPDPAPLVIWLMLRDGTRLLATRTTAGGLEVDECPPVEGELAELLANAVGLVSEAGE